MSNTYLQAAIPAAESKYRSVRTAWYGINKLNTLDSGQLSGALNIDVSALPCLITAPTQETVKTGYTTPVGLFGIDDFLIALYTDGETLKIDYIKGTNVYKASLTTSDTSMRSLVQFNVYTTPSDPLSGTFSRKLLLFPDKVSFDYDISADFTPTALEATPGQMPDIKYATVYLSRLFGVDDDRIYASAFNNYADWTLDTADAQLDSNAWATTSQSNTKADGSFTGITTYDGHVICFKRDFMHQIYNTKNPFRVVDIGQHGMINSRACAEVNGKLIFVSDDKVYLYTGGAVSVISTVLNIGSFADSVCGSYGSTFYLYVKGENLIYTYDINTEQWGCRSAGGQILFFASNDNGIYALYTDGTIKKLNTASYTGSWYFYTELIANEKLDIRRIKRISVLCEISTGASVNVGLASSDGTETAIMTSGSKTGLVTLRAGVRMSSDTCHRIKFSGSGYVKFHYMSLDVSYGGDLYVSN